MVVCQRLPDSEQGNQARQALVHHMLLLCRLLHELLRSTHESVYTFAQLQLHSA